MHIEKTTGKFGYHLVGGADEPEHARPDVQIFVRSSSLSQKADLAISPHLSTEAEIDQFINDALVALESVRADAKAALMKARAP